jgi:hypothetical protein
VDEWDDCNIDVLKPFKHEDHPQLMKQKASVEDFTMDLSKKKFPSFRHTFLYYMEVLTGWRI